ncbi:DUF748 domain-containing protein [Methylococcus capsulatus]|jgi:hypothetical protein|uniref:DUF748 domain-containing protein n=1 Tax=Methylococcus capsulatus TaxID=414 RepID=A0AA35V5M2_METCP|nr:DUF748 domain-containing protein [Methylococcus capsulatus]CAI8808871.1 conserved protein of unknown function [Methylococcus capsulatus]
MKFLPQWVRRSWCKAFAVVLALTGLYALLGFLILPKLVEQFAPELAARYLKRQLSIAEVGFNPFRFSLELRGFVLAEVSGEPLLSFGRLLLDFEPASLLEDTWTFSEVLIEQPSADLVVDEEGRLNLARLGDELPKSPEAEKGEGQPPALSFKHLSMVGGKVRFADRSRTAPFDETFESIDIEVADLSTLPEVQGTQHLTAKFRERAILDWQGRVSINPPYSEGRLRVGNFPLAALWPFVKERLALAEPAGELGGVAHYRLAEGPAGLALSVSDLSAQIEGLKLTPEGGSEPILALGRLEAREADFDPANRRVRMPKFEIREGRLRAAVDEAGEIDWLKLFRPKAAAAASAMSNDQPEPPWRIEVGAFGAAKIGVDYADVSRHSPIHLGIGALDLAFAAAIEVGTEDWKAAISRLALRLDNIALSTAGASGQGDDLATLESLTVEDANLDLAKREAAIGRIVLKGGGTRIVRETTGGIMPATALAPTSAGSRPPRPSERGAWRYAVQQFVLEDFGLALADRTFAPAIAYDLENIRLSLGPIASDEGRPMRFDAAFVVGQGGEFKASGSLSQSLDQAEGAVRLGRIDLKSLHPLVARFSGLELESGDLSAQLEFGYRRDAGTALKAKGDLSVGGLLLKETATGKRFLSWKNLSAEALDFGLAERRLAVKQVRVAEPGWNIEIFENRSTNIQRVVAGGRPAGAAPKPVGGRRRSEKPEPWLVTVEAVRVEKGDIDFSDGSLVLPFATHIHDFFGTAAGLSTRSEARALLQFHGQVDRYGAVDVYGQLSPLAPKHFGDVSVAFRNVDMPSLSPYSATFAGREITSGKLNLDIRYQIDDGRLRNDNRIVLERFALGERIESPKAVSLPLDLAIALLTDGDGRIDVSVPVEGDLGNPRFDYGKVIWEAFVNVVTRTVTAPFRALGRLFGGDGEEIGGVLFEPGSADVGPPEREKLNKVMVALAQRPRLSLEVHGGVDPELDGRALKSSQVRRSVAAKLGFRWSPEEEPGPVSFDSAATQSALEELAGEQGGPNAVEEVQSAFARKEGRKAERIGRISALMGRPSPDSAFYRALFDHLVETAPLSAQDLATLAGRRARAVVGVLTQRGALDPGRIRIGETTSGDVRDRRIVTRLAVKPGGS